MKRYPLTLSVALLCINLSFSQQTQAKEHYPKALKTIDSLIKKSQNQIKSINSAKKIALKPIMEPVARIRLDKAKELLKLEEKLKKNELTQKEFKIGKAKISKVLKRVDSIVVSNTVRFVKMYEKEKKIMDSLKAEKQKLLQTKN